LLQDSSVTQTNKSYSNWPTHNKQGGNLCFIDGGGVLWVCFGDDNFIYETKDGVQWWGTKDQWMEHVADHGKTPSPRDVTTLIPRKSGILESTIFQRPNSVVESKIAH
jgi:hypothetical protein